MLPGRALAALSWLDLRSCAAVVIFAKLAQNGSFWRRWWRPHPADVSMSLPSAMRRLLAVVSLLAIPPRERTAKIANGLIVPGVR
jgi:hypothetical protein